MAAISLQTSTDCEQNLMVTSQAGGAVYGSFNFRVWKAFAFIFVVCLFSLTITGGTFSARIVGRINLFCRVMGKSRLSFMEVATTKATLHLMDLCYRTAHLCKLLYWWSFENIILHLTDLIFGMVNYDCNSVPKFVLPSPQCLSCCFCTAICFVALNFLRIILESEKYF